MGVDEYLTGRRAAQPGFVEPSFPTIAGAGANGAIIHYRAQPGGCASIDGGTMLLVDSGAPGNSSSSPAVGRARSVPQGPNRLYRADRVTCM